MFLFYIISNPSISQFIQNVRYMKIYLLSSIFKLLFETVLLITFCFKHTPTPTWKSLSNQ